MRVGILGTGGAGQNLAAGFVAKGHDVVIGTRDVKATLAKTGPDRSGTPSLSQFISKNPKVKVVTSAEAAKHGEVVVLAVHGDKIESAVNAAGPDNLAGKLVLDTSNPLEFSTSGAHKPASIPDSCLQMAQRAAPKAHFVKAWNCTPGHLMADPRVPGGGDQFICGNDAKAKEKAAEILKSFGWGVCDVGDASMAPYIEGMALTAINYAAKTNDWGWALKMNGRKP